MSPDHHIDPTRSHQNPNALTALILSVLGVAAGVLPSLFVLALPLAVGGIAFGTVGLMVARRDPDSPGMGPASAALMVAPIALGLFGLGIAGQPL